MILFMNLIQLKFLSVVVQCGVDLGVAISSAFSSFPADLLKLLKLNRNQHLYTSALHLASRRAGIHFLAGALQFPFG